MANPISSDDKFGNSNETINKQTERKLSEGKTGDSLDTSDEGPYGCAGTSPGFLQCFNTIGWFSFFMCITTCIQVSVQAQTFYENGQIVAFGLF